MTTEQFFIFLALMIVLLTGVILIFIFQCNTSKYIVGKKFKLKNYYEHQASTNDITVKLSIHNPNFIDSRILGFGFSFNNRNIDYMSVYIKTQDTQLVDSKVIIPSRDFIYTIIDKDSIIKTVRYYNQGINKVKKMHMYVIDHQGETTKANAKLMKKLINESFSLEQKELNERDKELKLQEAIERKTLKKQNKAIKKEQRKERREIFMMNLKMKFTRKEKVKKESKKDNTNN